MGGDLLDEIARRLGHAFADPGLLQHALTHRSWCAEHPGEHGRDNERLEFLGDAVLAMVVTDHIYRVYADMSEGSMAKVRAAVVSAPALAERGRELGLGDGLRLGKGEELTGGRDKASILANAVEAVLGALYLDGGWPVASAAVLRLLATHIDEAVLGPGGGDFKTRLQEHAAQALGAVPRYRVSGDGPDHDKWFEAEVWLDDRCIGRGGGRTKKEAEQAAAADAWLLVASDAGAPA